MCRLLMWALLLAETFFTLNSIGGFDDLSHMFDGTPMIVGSAADAGTAAANPETLSTASAPPPASSLAAHNLPRDLRSPNSTNPGIELYPAVAHRRTPSRRPESICC